MDIALYYIGTLSLLLIAMCSVAYFFENTEIGDRLFEKIMEKLEVENDD